MSERVPFTTNRDELWDFIRSVPSQFNEYRIEEGTARVNGRRYHKDVGDLCDAFRRFCDEKEAAAKGKDADAR